MESKIGSKDQEKSLYLVQIRYLEEQLEGCQLKCDKLEAQNQELVSEYDALEKDKKNSTEHLKCLMMAKRKKVSELWEELQKQQRTAKQDEEALKLKHQQQMEKLQQLRDEMESKRRIQASKLEEQLKEAETLQKQLLIDKEEEEAAIHHRQAEEALKRERMLTSIEKFVEAVAEEQEEWRLLQRAKEQHSCRLKQLPCLQSQAERLTKERDALQDKEVELSRELDEVKKDTLKMNTLKPKLNKELQQIKKEYQQLVAEIRDGDVAQQHTADQTEGLRQRLNSVSEKFAQKSSKLDQLEAELQRERSRKTELEGIKQEADIILGFILTDLGKVIDTQWKLQRLLEILESSAISWKTGFGLNNSPQRRKPQTSRPVRKLGSLRTCSSVEPSDPTPQHADLESRASTSADR
ncbi:cilia- and flagella-associated protein 157-like [Amphiprion ocellaris]|uniref:cilia- and flagella-associated protein 157-like n=1 Tax=Amphiprion ocellaris TaxID=80972 RepID=UPI0024112A38|nr:cilia- and flagella-associated protein 157-like [Amphiprion ocellaris]